MFAVLGWAVCGCKNDNEEMFKLYLIKEFECLKEKEREQAGRNAGREL